ncbi:FtsW/RodA/SpoVE family cell cycle protein [Staphylococcus nepalensis]|uniref:FtsW/RodA/SpoVE family cell cycle protein n=1 Tax=Staphylococcus nepalensis TaxID=214473 RepID=UPI002271D887|nr:FtsW/RodA/SpoVE family cell cycle protein [Staphylococcus nepalensis]MCY1038296.1 FtsW/RodA/SpoVE family cell cycle protein [Staphylococcus nepalensis]
MKHLLKQLNESKKGVDISLLICFIILGVIGVIMVYSASMVPAAKGALTGGQAIPSDYFMKKQFTFLVLGILIIVVSLFININILKHTKVQMLIVFGTLVLLCLTVLIGKEVNGSKNWINLGFFSVQSSEFLKLTSIFYLSYIINQRLTSRQHHKLSYLFAPLFLLGIGLVLVLLQGDLGGTVLTVGIIACILIYSGITNKVKLQVMGFTLIPMAFYLIYTLMIDSENTYRLKRINVMINPFKYESDDGYQLTSALMSIGNGGFSGNGLGNGVAKLGYLPEPHTDFIFTVIAEELGLIGVLFILIIYGFILFKGLIYANKTRNHFYKLICVGIVSYLFIQVFVNLAGISGLIPLTGVTLPLLSYGGSSMLSVSIAFGTLLAVTKKINEENKMNADKGY